MIQREFWDCAVEIDEAATQSWYATAPSWNCTCGHCRHFLKLAGAGKLPAPVSECLEELGIPAEKATYVCQIVRVPAGDLYQFSYRIAGRIVAEKPPVKQAWGEVRCCHEPYPYGAPGFPQPHFDLEFWVELPPIPEEGATL